MTFDGVDVKLYEPRSRQSNVAPVLSTSTAEGGLWVAQVRHIR
ncbi:hypothetical protein NP493_1690g00023 [Ridgeia piscesae]|uniref:Uncharacterized protein n=1 Tax=Ridgeia piscesae TaxID=27915 RepID=A0AAD9JWJ8_RIDPI|nr:hypothetical protein NP493_1690g00023 [Ridgeia piscesae]